MTRDGPQCICLLVILLDSIFRIGKNYYPQLFLGECKYTIKEKKIDNYIIDDINIASDSDELCWKKFRWKKILIMKKILMNKFWKKFRWKIILMKKPLT